MNGLLVFMIAGEESAAHVGAPGRWRETTKEPQRRNREAGPEPPKASVAERGAGAGPTLQDENELLARQGHAGSLHLALAFPGAVSAPEGHDGIPHLCRRQRGTVATAT